MSDSQLFLESWDANANKLPPHPFLHPHPSHHQKEYMASNMLFFSRTCCYLYIYTACWIFTQIFSFSIRLNGEAGFFTSNIRKRSVPLKDLQLPSPQKWNPWSKKISRFIENLLLRKFLILSFSCNLYNSNKYFCFFSESFETYWLPQCCWKL